MNPSILLEPFNIKARKSFSACGFLSVTSVRKTTRAFLKARVLEQAAYVLGNFLRHLEKVTYLVFRTIFLCCLGFNGLAQENNSSNGFKADLFKSFIENPPAIKNLIYAQEIPGLTTNYFRLKFQDSALFVGWSTSPLPPIEGAGSSKDYIEWIGRFGDEYLNKSYNGIFSWTNQNDLKKASNTVELHFQDAQEKAGKILNMGCQFASIGKIHWIGDTFLITNVEQQVWVEGHLSRDKEEKAASMLIMPHRLGHHQQDLVPSSYAYSYDYDGSTSLSYLPNVIDETFTQKNGELFAVKYKIVALEVATNLMNVADFIPNPHVETNLVYITITNGYRVYSGPVVGRSYVMPDTQVINQTRTTLSKYYFALAICLLILPPILFVTSKVITIKNKKQKEK